MLCSTPRAVPLSRFFSAILLLLSVVSKSRISALSDYVVSRKRDPALASRKKLGVHVDCVYAAPCGNKFGRSSRDSVLLVRFTLTRLFRGVREFGRNFAHAFASELFRVLVDVLLCAPDERRIRKVENETLL